MAVLTVESWVESLAVLRVELMADSRVAWMDAKMVV